MDTVDLLPEEPPACASGLMDQCSVEIVARLRDVVPDLAGQRIEIGIALLVAKLVDEFDANPLAVDGVVEVENEDLEQRNAGCRYRRANANARDTSSRRA